MQVLFFKPKQIFHCSKTWSGIVHSQQKPTAWWRHDHCQVPPTLPPATGTLWNLCCPATAWPAHTPWEKLCCHPTPSFLLIVLNNPPSDPKPVNTHTRWSQAGQYSHFLIPDWSTLTLRFQPSGREYSHSLIPNQSILTLSDPRPVNTHTLWFQTGQHSHSLIPDWSTLTLSDPRPVNTHTLWS